MRRRSAGSAIFAQCAGSGGGLRSLDRPEQPRNSVRSSGKWRYTVARRTPARSAIAEIVGRDGPTVPPVCYWQVVVADNSYKSPDNGQRHCER